MFSIASMLLLITLSNSISCAFHKHKHTVSHQLLVVKLSMCRLTLCTVVLQCAVVLQC